MMDVIGKTNAGMSYSKPIFLHIHPFDFCIHCLKMEVSGISFVGLGGSHWTTEKEQHHFRKQRICYRETASSECFLYNPIIHWNKAYEHHKCIFIYLHYIIFNAVNLQTDISNWLSFFPIQFGLSFFLKPWELCMIRLQDYTAVQTVCPPRCAVPSDNRNSGPGLNKKKKRIELLSCDCPADELIKDSQNTKDINTSLPSAGNRLN